MYHTLIENIQILGKTHFYNFSDFDGIGYNIHMGILDNLENSWDDEFNFESSIYKPEMESLAVKLFSETCCDGCSCQSESDHLKQ